MSPPPQHGTPSGDAFLALSRLARSTGQDSQDLFTMYALEGLLARLVASPYRGDFVLKGGVLLAAFMARRPTKDIDLWATNLDNDMEAVAERFHEIVMIDLGDGLTFHPDTIKTSVIRDDEEYEGIRLRLQASLGKTRLFIGIDVNFGDPIWPAPQTVAVPPLGNVRCSPVELYGYPLPMAIAEKVVTIIQRGEANTRWRDFADIFTLKRLHSFDADMLHRSISTTADYRAIRLAPLLPALSGMPAHVQAKWKIWWARQERHAGSPESFAEVLQSIATFTDPVLSGTAYGKTWNPKDQAWR